VETVLWTAVRLFPKEQWAKIWLEKGYYGLGDTKQLLRLYSLMLEQSPKDFVAKNNLASAMLLLNTNVDRASTLAQEAYDQHETNAMVACTYAYSLQVQGKTTEALDVFKKMSESDRRRPGIAAYYSAILNAAGDKEQAKVYRAYAEKGQLLPEEKGLLR
jgi:tetratricopeptide (TPR) repeat protein